MKKMTKVMLDGVEHDVEYNEAFGLGAQIAKKLWEPVGNNSYTKGVPSIKPKDLMYLTNLLMKLKTGDEQFTVKDVADTEYVTPRTAYSHIQTLEKNGLLKKVSDEGDGIYAVDHDGMEKYCGARFVFEEVE